MSRCDRQNHPSDRILRLVGAQGSPPFEVNIGQSPLRFRFFIVPLSRTGCILPSGVIRKRLVRPQELPHQTVRNFAWQLTQRKPVFLSAERRGSGHQIVERIGHSTQAAGTRDDQVRIAKTQVSFHRRNSSIPPTPYFSCTSIRAGDGQMDAACGQFGGEFHPQTTTISEHAGLSPSDSTRRYFTFGDPVALQGDPRAANIQSLFHQTPLGGQNRRLDRH